MKLTILMAAFGDGGVERMVVNTATGLARRGVEIRFLTGDADGPWLERLHPDIATEPLPGGGLARLRRVIGHLRQDRPDVILVAKARDARLALRARRLARSTTALVMRPGTAISERVSARGLLAGRLKLARLARLYRRADLIVANSAGVRDDIAAVAGVPPARVRLVRNPVITPDLDALAQQAVDDPWLGDPAVPLILGAGGLRQQKDFSMLIRACARLRASRPARLLILGRGRQQARLQALARELGVGDHVRLGGFVDNPYPWMAGCDLFALSSRWEGSPNVLTEAMALGTPVVATDCRSGPREILAGGEHGPLVPVGDAVAMADAMARVLDAPPSAGDLRAAVADYTVERNAAHYHALLDELVNRGRD